MNPVNKLGEADLGSGRSVEFWSAPTPADGMRAIWDNDDVICDEIMEAMHSERSRRLLSEECLMGWKKLPSGGWVLESGNRRVTLHQRVSGIYPWAIQRFTHIEAERGWVPIKQLLTFKDESEARSFGENFVMSGGSAMKGTDEMMENNAIYALKRAIRALRDVALWMEGASEHHKIQAHLVKGHVEPLEGILGAMIENRKRRRDGGE